jgi:uncharacterized damage-inducible protein DinB
MMSGVAVVQHLYDYNYWATRKLLGGLSSLSPEEFVKPVAGSYESIRNTLVHTVSAEWGWLDRCGGESRGKKLDPNDDPSLESVSRTWERVEGYMRDFLSKLSDADLERPITFAIPSGPEQSARLGDLLLHGIVHGAHHRGQVAMLVRLLGHSPGNFDLVFFALDGADEY